MKDVEGYLTSDNKFFESPVEAELHEAVVALTAKAKQHKHEAEAVILVCHQFPHEILRFIHAFYTADPLIAEGHHEDEAKQSLTLARAAQAAGKGLLAKPYSLNVGDNEDDTTAARLPPSEQQLASGRGEPMPDIRSRIVSEAIRNTGALNGSRSGRTDAPSVRGSEDMAARTQTEIAQALRERREAMLWGDAVEEDNDRD